MFDPISIGTGFGTSWLGNIIHDKVKLLPTKNKNGLITIDVLNTQFIEFYNFLVEYIDPQLSDIEKDFQIIEHRLNLIEQAVRHNNFDINLFGGLSVIQQILLIAQLNALKLTNVKISETLDDLLSFQEYSLNRLSQSISDISRQIKHLENEVRSTNRNVSDLSTQVHELKSQLEKKPSR